MIQRFLKLLATLDGKRSPRSHLFKIVLRNDPFLDERFGGKQLHLEPNLELALLGPNFPHLLS